MRKKIALMIMTNGRRECIEKTIPSALKNLDYEFEPKIIVDDSGDRDYALSLRQFEPDFWITPTDRPRGFCGSIARAWEIVSKIGIDYIFHLEDDFLFNERIRISEMIAILEDNPKLAQVALLRQPVSKPERQAGGVIQAYEQDFHQQDQNGKIWTEHARFFTTNCSLYPVSITSLGYPIENQCEGKFSIKLRNLGYRFAYLGRKNQKPKIEHIGHKRGKRWAWYWPEEMRQQTAQP